MDGEQCGRVSLAKGDLSATRRSTTNPAAYKTTGDFQSDEVTRGEKVPGGARTVPARLFGGQGWHGIRLAETVFGGARQDQYGGRMAPAGRANGAASRLSRPGPDPALPAPRPSAPTILVRTLGKQACTCRATTCLCTRARGSPDLLGEFSRQVQIWLSNAIRGPGLVTLAKQPGQPTCHAFFCRGTPFSPAPAACHC